MNRELLMLVDAISHEKNVDREVVFGAVESALASATRARTEYPGRLSCQAASTASRAWPVGTSR